MSEIDITNFSSSSPHRLPTLSASEALQNLTSAPKQFISTGMRNLDACLQDHQAASPADIVPGGLMRGQVNEIYGPPGIGKTAFAMQVAVNALQSGDSAVWIDTSYTLSGPNFRKRLFNSATPRNTDSPYQSSGKPLESLLENFHHYHTPTLPHLLALLTHPSPSFPHPKTSLIIVEAISTLFSLAFPKALETIDAKKSHGAKKNDAIQWAASRRWAVMGDFINKVGKLAATRNIAILLVSQTTTRISADTGAVLHPAMASTAWDAAISTRIVLFRDWVFQTAEGPSKGEVIPGVRFMGVVKAGGISYGGLGKVTSFTIEEHGLQETNLNQEHASNNSPILPAPSLKRKRGSVADSESEDGDVASDEEFGWLGVEDPLATEGPARN